MKALWVVAVGMLCGIGCTDAARGQNVAVGDDVSVDGASPKVRVVFHQGAILGIGNDALLTYTPEAGSIVVLYGDGQVVEGLVSPLPKPEMATATAWIHDDSLLGLQPGQAKAGCSNEQTALSSAIAGVQAACQPGSGQTSVCTAAQDFLREAYSSFNECIRRLIQAK